MYDKEGEAGVCRRMLADGSDSCAGRRPLAQQQSASQVTLCELKACVGGAGGPFSPRLCSGAVKYS
jgi:hypothetical protein